MENEWLKGPVKSYKWGISYNGFVSERPTGCCELCKGLTVLRADAPSLAVAVDAAETPSESPRLWSAVTHIPKLAPR